MTRNRLMKQTERELLDPTLCFTDHKEEIIFACTELIYGIGVASLLVKYGRPKSCDFFFFFFFFIFSRRMKVAKFNHKTPHHVGKVPKTPIMTWKTN
jgi:hypothetical protein